jgi:protein-S-isoprenylcysteine O-methyltransferase Ste14
MKETGRYIAGYIVGAFLFLLAVPLGFYELAAADHRLWAVRPFDGTAVRLALAAPFFVLGVVFVAWSNWALFKIGRGGPTDGFGVAVSPRTKELVITGPYRLTRNPMVFGALSVYFSWGIFLNSTLCLALVLAAIPLIIVYLRSTEEKRLARDFGRAFLEYRTKVPVLLPRPRRSKASD